MSVADMDDLGRDYFAVDMANGFTYVGCTAIKGGISLEDVVVMETVSASQAQKVGKGEGYIIKNCESRAEYYVQEYLQQAARMNRSKEAAIFEALPNYQDNRNVVSVLKLGTDILH